MPPAVFVGKENMRETDPWLTGGASAAPAAGAVVPATTPEPPAPAAIEPEVEQAPVDVFDVDSYSETE